MATKLHNLSEYNPDTLPNADVVARQRFAIIVADWNSQVTYKLLDGAIETLLNCGAREDHLRIYHVPGTIELTYAAEKLVPQPDKYDYDLGFDAIIVIGCVIQGDTPHFTYVCESVTQGVTLLNTRGTVPVIFSVLTTLNLEQAMQRAGGELGNKGVEGALTAIKMANLTFHPKRINEQIKQGYNVYVP